MLGKPGQEDCHRFAASLDCIVSSTGLHSETLYQRKRERQGSGRGRAGQGKKKRERKKGKGTGKEKEKENGRERTYILSILLYICLNVTILSEITVFLLAATSE